ncbi:hypothetical protein KIH31_09420 [Paenarthrobacter sp. DKR-5]|uniref:hypothetical protein n=1 Tax=Paenarthrobacter sp. DKR-5 TaxID=2835535 RepID=UPI001BDBF776|nr:hypothetical protein [Paenarthrobacter sp. DKR-5]MBT1002824.1 hypothetical protein [Paenarthrobacter sp. DKR-5]
MTDLLHDPASADHAVGYSSSCDQALAPASVPSFCAADVRAREVWLAAAALEGADFQRDQAQRLLVDCLQAALTSGSRLQDLAEASGLTPVEILAVTGSSAMLLSPEQTRRS